MLPRHPQNFTLTQPKTYKLSVKSFLSLPFRLCNPPPAVAKVRSCGVTPILKVRLEDVLDREHLPPLGLKDFEEWLLFVEMSPENLYFILWLREYKQRYNQWKSQSAFQNRNTSMNYAPSSPPYSSHLAMFYSRAKQTFFTPGSEYELNLSSHLLAPFHKANNPPHPNPELFMDVELETYRTLEGSLRRFVQAQLNNVGNRRVLCGMIAGILILLIIGVPPLTASLAVGESRWSRLSAFPGFFIGLSVFLASLHGVCIGVYIFGDIRQLRKFELARPPISKPQPLPTGFKRRTVEARPLSATNSILPIQQPRKQSTANSVIITSSSNLNPPLQRQHQASISSEFDDRSSQASSMDDGIQISPAYYDPDEIEGPATCTWYYADQEPEYQFPPKEESQTEKTEPNSYNTATFIHPFQIKLDEEELERSLCLPERNQPMLPFDFDSLPQRTDHRAKKPKSFVPFLQTNNLLPRLPEPAAPSGLLERVQMRCNLAKWRLQTGFLESDGRLSSGSPIPPHPSSPYWSEHLNHSNVNSMAGSTHRNSSEVSEKLTADPDTESKIRKRLRMMFSVPAFSAPVTRVLSPVIQRAQWEVVVRSALFAFVLTWTILGSLLAIPPKS